jgi:bacteriocin biosynthesis cyclodehydratase domain-containing protein
VRKVNLPYLPPWYRIAAGSAKVVIEYGQRVVCFEGAAAELLLPVLLPLLDGMRTVEEIIVMLGEPARPAVENALARLVDHGLLVEGPPLATELPRPVAGSVELLTSLRVGTGVGDTAAALGARSVGVVGDGGSGVEAARFLRTAGVEVERLDRIAGADLVVCAPTAAELPHLPEWNGQALATSQPWLQILPFDGRYATAGPLYLPGETGCYECFRRRRVANLAAPEELALLELVPATYPTTPALDALLGAVAAQVALHWLVLGDHYTPAGFYALETLPSIALTTHYLHRVPRCEACSGIADIAGPLPWYKEMPLAAGL